MNSRQTSSPQKISSHGPAHYLDHVVVRLNCYEPNSQKIELTGEHLCRNTLYVGTVGSGKTTCMNPLLRDLIRFRANQPGEKIGLLVIDSKVDDTVQKISMWAQAAGRADDLQILSPESPFYYDFLAELKDFTQVETLVEKIITAFPWNNSGDNDYWEQGRKPLLKAALTISLINCLGREVEPTHALVMGFIQDWLMSPNHPSGHAGGFIRQFHALSAQIRGRLQPGEQAIIDETIATIKMWDGLESRIKTTWNSVILNCLSPFSDMAAQSYFAGQNRRRLRLSEIVEQGKIVVVSINAGENPALAKLLGRLVKADFYQTLQSRQIGYANEGRLAGLVMDEYPLVVTSSESRYGDIAQLQSLRSKRGFVVAATQGFTSLDMVVGYQARQALLLNFNNLFLFNSHETAVDQFAALHFGRKPATVQASLEWEESQASSDVAQAPSKRRQKMKAEIEEWVCPQGALGNLEVGQAYVSLAQGRRYLGPVWLEPLYYEPAISASAPPLKSRHDTLKNLFQEVNGGAKADDTEAEPGKLMLSALDGEVAIDFTEQEYVDLFVNPDGLFTRYYQDKPGARSQLSIHPEQNDQEKVLMVIFPRLALAEACTLPAKTPSDQEFLRFYGSCIQQTDDDPEESAF